MLGIGDGAFGGTSTTVRQPSCHSHPGYREVNMRNPGGSRGIKRAERLCVAVLLFDTHVQRERLRCRRLL
jgi:hypothetical protein